MILPVYEPCPICDGKGTTQWEDEIDDCDFCEGEGTVIETKLNEFHEDQKADRDFDEMRDRELIDDNR